MNRILEFFEYFGLPQIVTLVILIILPFILGSMCGALAKEKRYKYGTHFLLGFLLGVFGLIYCAGLPDKSPRRVVAVDKKHLVKTDIVLGEDFDYESDEPIDYWCCRKCGTKNHTSFDYCAKCGTPRKTK